MAGLEGASLMTKVRKDIRALETYVEELRRYLALYRQPLPVPILAGRADR